MKRNRSRDETDQDDDELVRCLKRRQAKIRDFLLKGNAGLEMRNDGDGNVSNEFLNFLAYLRINGGRQTGMYENVDCDGKVSNEFLNFLAYLRMNVGRQTGSGGGDEVDPQYDHLLKSLTKDVDSQYEQFLKSLRKDVDSQYDQFLKSLRKDGDSQYDQFLKSLRKDGDSQYDQFLKSLRKDGKSYSLETVEEVDPQYEQFLESLRKDEKFYLLEIVDEHGKTLYLKYEVEDELNEGEEPNGDDEINEGDEPKEDPQYDQFLKSLRKVVDSEYDQFLKSSRKDVDSQYDQSLKSLRKDVDYQFDQFLKSLRKDGKSYSLDTVEEVDPQYEQFLESLRKDGKFYLLEIVDEHERPLYLKYEEEGELNEGDEPNGDDEINEADEPNEDDNLNEGNDLNEVDELNENDEVNGDDELNEGHIPISRKKLSKVVRSSSGLPNVDYGERWKRPKKCEGKAVEISTLWKSKVIKQEYQDPEELNQCASYRNNVSHAHFKSGHPSRIADITIENDKVDSSLDSEILVLNNVSDFNAGNNNPVVTSKKFIHFPVEPVELPNTMNHSLFKERLMSVIRKPYDEIEYKRLMMEAKKKTHRSGRHRDLRGNAALKSYPSNEFNKSYLEQHADLKLKLFADTMDKFNQLNLLRAFFFWLENLSHDGAIQPWMDPVCLKIIQSKNGVGE